MRQRGRASSRKSTEGGGVSAQATGGHPHLCRAREAGLWAGERPPPCSHPRAQETITEAGSWEPGSEREPEPSLRPWALMPRGHASGQGEWALGGRKAPSLRGRQATRAFSTAHRAT